MNDLRTENLLKRINKSNLTNLISSTPEKKEIKTVKSLKKDISIDKKHMQKENIELWKASN